MVAKQQDIFLILHGSMNHSMAVSLTMSPNWKIWKQSHLYIASFKIGDIKTQHK